MTEDNAAATSTMPNTCMPMSPSAIWNTDAGGLSGSRDTPPETTPRTARNSKIRMTPVVKMP